MSEIKMSRRMGIVGTVGMAAALVASGCGTSKEDTRGYVNRFDYADSATGQTLICYSNNDVRVVKPKNPANMAVAIRNAYCPDSEMNERYLKSRDTEFPGRKVIELPYNPHQIIPQAIYFDVGATMPPPMGETLFSNE